MPGLGFQAVGIALDVVLFLFVALHLGLVGRPPVLRGRQITRELGQRLLGALGLEEGPLVGRFGLLDGRVVLVQPGIGLGGAATGPCGLGGRRSVLELQTESGIIVYSQGTPPSSIWRGEVLMRCGPAFSLSGAASVGQFQNRVLIDGLQSQGFRAENLDGTRLQLRLIQELMGPTGPVVIESEILTSMR